jgi:glycogen debranching enzyme
MSDERVDRQTRPPEVNGHPDGEPARPDDPYYILAATPAADEQRRVLKQGDTFAVFDRFGDIRPTGLGEEGLFHGGTRHLSCLLLALGRERPMFLSSTVRESNDALAVDLTNPDVVVNGRVTVPRGTLHLARTRFLWGGACYERLRARNYHPAPIRTTLALHFGADFADIFEVRGARRPARGRRLATAVAGGAVTLAYQGLDDVTRRTRLTFSPAPAALTASDARFDLELPPQGEVVIELTVACAAGGDAPEPLPFAAAQSAAAADLQAARDRFGALRATNERFNDWVTRAASDLHMMVTATPYGPYPYAGVPWFSTPFGRDGLITALECLWLNPGLAKGVLAYLAATQATEVNPAQDAQPGKILHETRGGEMAVLGEIPFGRYYGSVDATPLFALLAGAYYDRTGDRLFVKSIWPNVEAALRWCDQFGDPDGDGFVEYARSTPQGLANQGWKDSHDAVFHADATLAEGPIALCEVQGYVYAAKRAAAELARALGQPARADDLERQADALRKHFERAFWCEEIGTYALALDGAKRPCRVRTSNAGHCLATGIADPEHARRVAETLMHPDSFSGWGVRTVAASEVNYNPMSYHNGSVWPHDNALVAWGLCRYGQPGAALKVLDGMFEASLFLDLHRLPELFCGFPRRNGEGPTLYPVACAPQAWSAAAVYLLVQSCLGLTVSAVKHEVCFAYPVLPGFLRELRIHNLRVGRASVDLLLRRHGPDVGINVLRREGDVHVCMVK